MNRRKQPFILITILVVLFGAIGFYNLMAYDAGGKGHDDQVLTGEAQGGDERAKMESRLGNALGDKSGTHKPMPTAKELPDPGPAVSNPGATSYKPQPNDNATSGLWYKKNSH